MISGLKSSAGSWFAPKAKGVSLAELAGEILAREAGLGETPASSRTGQELIDSSAKIRGLFTDEEIDEMFSRNRSPGRSIDLE